MALPRARVIDGNKFMWDGKEYETAEEAEQARAQYGKDGFETRIVEEEGKIHVFSRRVVTSVVVDGESPT